MTRRRLRFVVDSNVLFVFASKYVGRRRACATATGTAPRQKSRHRADASPERWTKFA